MKITIYGGGNIGTQFAVQCTKKGHDVGIYTSKPEKFGKFLYLVNQDNHEKICGNLSFATNDSKKAFSNSDLIFVTVPAFIMKDAAKTIYPYVNKNTLICLVPGTGGGEFAFKQLLKKGCIIFGLQRVPSVARLIEYGQSVSATGYRKNLYVASIPLIYSKFCANLIEEIFDINTTAMQSYLNLTLTPSNPILHTARLAEMFKDYTKGMTYKFEKRAPLFYEDWDMGSSERLLLCDDELQKLCDKIKQKFDLSYVKSLREHYESKDAWALTEKIRSILGFKGLKAPVIVDVDKSTYRPDFKDRYFKADFAYGLSIIEQIANFYDIDVPEITKIMKWYRQVREDEGEFDFKDYGINSVKDFIKFYEQ